MRLQRASRRPTSHRRTGPAVAVPRFLVGAAVVAAGAVGLSVVPSSAPVQAGPVTHTKVVSSNPIDTTPDILDGTVWDIVHVGPNKYLAAGSFTKVTGKDDGVTLTRTGLVLFNSLTGHVYRAFDPQLDGAVRAAWLSSDGGSVFVGGEFGTVNGKERKRLARIDFADGHNTPDFHPPALNGDVYDITVTHDMLVVSGLFKKVGSTSQVALTAFKRSTGEHLHFFDDIKVAGTHNGGGTHILNMEAQTSGANHLMLIGNFATVNGQARNQIAMLTIGGGRSRAALTDWSVPNYATKCGAAFDAPIRDVAYGPAGHYIVVVASGGYTAGSYCDAAARFDTDARGAQQATWVNYTGGDTLTAVEITGAAVYVGGHQRWMNNPLGHDDAGPGAVARKGIAALDTSGNLLAWNPSRDRGVGVRVLLAVPSGLWIGDDTCEVAGEVRCRVKQFPLS